VNRLERVASALAKQPESGTATAEAH